MLSEAKAGLTGKVTISSARAISSLNSPNRSRPNRMPVRWPLCAARPQRPRRLDRRAHRLEAVALARRGGKHEIEVGDRRSPDRQTPRSPSITWSALLAAARALSFGQPSRGLTSLSSASPKFAMARATMPIFSPSCGSTRMMTGFDARAARDVPWRGRPAILCREFKVWRPDHDGRRSGRAHTGVDRRSSAWRRDPHVRRHLLHAERQHAGRHHEGRRAAGPRRRRAGGGRRSQRPAPAA